MSRLFRNDYSELCHEKVFEEYRKALCEQNDPYGLDKYSKSASELIRKEFDCEEAEVHFLVGGTQANMTVISYLLKDYEAVLAVNSGHINVHETGAVEGSGHKIYTVKGVDGKVTAKEIKDALKINNNEHCVKIRMVYISDSTEIGTIYSLSELEEISKVCKENDLYLFLDGARLGVALTSSKNDIKPSDISKYCDVFYIGGTKNGLMFGEAVVITNKDLQKDFRWQIKNKGAMLAKGFACSIGFDSLFRDGLYFKLAKNSNEQADYLKRELVRLGFDVAPSYTNQLFVTMNKDKAKDLVSRYGCEEWTDLGDKMTIRFVTSFSTKKEDVKELVEYLEK